MNWLDLLFSPKGTIKAQPFSLVVIAVYAINLAAGSLLEGKFVMRASIWPYLFLQFALTWVWFIAHSKRLRDAGRGNTVAMVIAVIYACAIAVIVYATAASMTESTSTTSAGEPGVSLIGVIVAVLFINTLLSGDFLLISALLFVLLIVPLLLAAGVVVYSIVTGARPSLTPDFAVPPPAPAA
jgi:hypothetical protein